LYYEGFSNGTLWPLFHDVVVPPEYPREWWNSYVEINQRFAEVTAAAAAPEPTVWVQDYNLLLLPKLLRNLRPNLPIGFFLHIPLWPLLHDRVVPPEYHREWWNSYVEINQRFAEVTAAAAAPEATVWVQDYQLLLVPKLLRKLRPDLTIGFFLHIPFPPVE